MSTAVITGGSRGIGEAIVRELAVAGFDLAFCFLQSKERAEELAREVEAKYRVRCLAIQADVASLESMQNFAHLVADEFGSVTALVNNAGIVRDRTVHKMSEQEWREVIETNLNSVFYSCQVFLPCLEEEGSIVNISSVIGEIGAFGQANYAAAKAGIIGFTKSLAREVAKKRITVNAVTPGFVGTEMLSSIPEEKRRQIEGTIPLGRLGRPEEVASLVAYLSSPAARYITGTVLRIDGGYGLK